MNTVKVDYKKQEKNLYIPKQTPTIVEVPSMTFIGIQGQGDPNGEEFEQVVTALYSFAYAVKMSYRSKEVPDEYYEYTVYPLEGVWDLVDKSISHTVKSNLQYNMMIRQPSFLTKELFDRFLEEIKKKKPNSKLEKLEYFTAEEGLCCQMLHMGSYDSEPESFRIMENYCLDHGYERACKTHREIYLSDPRKTEASKLKTVLRFQAIQK